MRPKIEFVESCEALAQGFEEEGRPDLAAMCDRAAYWLNGGDGVDLISVGEVVASCRGTLQEAFETEASLEGFMARTTEEIVDNLRSIEAEVIASANQADPEELVAKAAKLQAVSILVSGLLK